MNNLTSISFDRNYVNCPTCGRSIEFTELTAEAAAVQQQVAKMPEAVQRQYANGLQPIRSCKVCQSRMQQSAYGQLGQNSRPQ